MKTKIFVVVVFAALILMVSATVWEGVTDVVSGKDLPGNYSVATNSFPKNSVVDITNLENGKVVRALVVSGLETTGLLATLSRNAANSINLRGNSTCRIRITQPSDDIAFSRFKLGPVADKPSASEPDTIAEKKVSTDNAADNADAAEAVTGIAAATAAETTEPVLAGDNIGDNAGVAAAQPMSAATTEPDARAIAEPAAVKPVERVAGTTAAGTRAATPVRSAAEPAQEGAAGTLIAARAAEETPENAAVQTPAQAVTESPAPVVTEPVKSAATATGKPAPTDSSYKLVTTSVVQPPTQPATENPPESGKTGVMSIVPSEERPPEAANQSAIASKDFVAPLKTNNVPNNVSNPSNASSASKASNAPPPGTSDFSPFQAPLISRLEKGKCYVQVAAYQRVDHVEDEISRIGTAYPLAVQNIGSDTKPMFRILLGPLNQGESGAMLQRIKSIGYKDAFIRYN